MASNGGHTDNDTFSAAASLSQNRPFDRILSRCRNAVNAQSTHEMMSTDTNSIEHRGIFGVILIEKQFYSFAYNPSHPSTIVR